MRPVGESWAGGMSDQTGSGPPGTGRSDLATQMAELIAPLVKQARSNGFDFLAYLLAMALKEARRLSEK